MRDREVIQALIVHPATINEEGLNSTGVLISRNTALEVEVLLDMRDLLARMADHTESMAIAAEHNLPAGYREPSIVELFETRELAAAQKRISEGWKLLACHVVSEYGPLYIVGRAAK